MINQQMHIYKYVQFSIIIIIIIRLLLVDHLSKPHSLMLGHGTYYYYYGTYSLKNGGFEKGTSHA
jgi:hypothetical protein